MTGHSPTPDHAMARRVIPGGPDVFRDIIAAIRGCLSSGCALRDYRDGIRYAGDRR